MLYKLKQKIGIVVHRPEPVRIRVSVTRPEPPLGFVPRSDPNYYFLSNRH